MKKFITLLSVVMMLLATACATSNYSFGRDFSTDNVSKIIKGKTTSADLIQLFGEPFSKTVISETEEKWIYSHARGSATAQSYVFTMKVESKGIQKTLDILLKNGVVTNFTFTEGPGPYNAVVQ